MEIFLYKFSNRRAKRNVLFMNQFNYVLVFVLSLLASTNATLNYGTFQFVQQPVLNAYVPSSGSNGYPPNQQANYNQNSFFPIYNSNFDANNIDNLNTNNNYNSHSNNNNNNQNLAQYEYIIPLRLVNSCPSFATFKFSCPTNHLISIESLTFAPLQQASSSECVPNLAAECKDQGAALDYAIRECSGREQCNLMSYQLRSKTKCSFHQIISIQYKCLPTWEESAMSTKSDICKNVTLNGNQENFGFVHSAWYPLMYPRLTCHSIIKNKPNHLIVIYSVSGSIGLDRILMQSVNEHGLPVVKEILTGNLTTKLILTSSYDVNVSILTEDRYYYAYRRFLLYYYLVPKCNSLNCANHTTTTSTTHSTQPVYPMFQTQPPPSYSSNANPAPAYPVYPTDSPNVYYPTNPPNMGYASNLPSIVYATSPPYAVYTSNPTQPPVYPHPSTIPIQPTPPIYPTESSQTSTTTQTTTTETTKSNNSTYAPSMKGEDGSKLSDAWLAAILALVYALIMVFAVLTAIYCRRRKKRRIEKENKVIMSQSCLNSSSQIITAPVTRTHSQISVRASSLPVSENYGIYLNSSQENRYNSEYIYSKVGRENHNATIMTREIMTERVPPTYINTEFDNYSQVLTEDDNYSAQMVINQTEQEINHHHHHYDSSENSTQIHRLSDSGSFPLTIKTNTQLGSIATSAGVLTHSSDTYGNSFRVVEFTKSPALERVRIRDTDSDENDAECEEFEAVINTRRNEYENQAFRIDHHHHHSDEDAMHTYFQSELTENIHFEREEQINFEQTEKRVVVKLYPYDEQDKETQELSMYVDAITTNQTNL